VAGEVACLQQTAGGRSRSHAVALLGGRQKKNAAKKKAQEALSVVYVIKGTITDTDTSNRSKLLQRI
jgi:hypothetical protein